MSIPRKVVFILALSILFSSPFFMGVNAQADDAYEPNDTLATAWNFGNDWVRTWLSDINGLGVQANDDWYRIDVDPGADRVQVDCRFTHAGGDIDIALYDSIGNILAESYSANDNELINHPILSAGTYYIRIYYSDVGNTYDLRWDDLTEDAYEENDTLGTAWYPGYKWERTWLANIDGWGIQADEDWYRIDVDPVARRVQVECNFTHAEGDINIALYDSTGTLLIESTTANDNEFIDYSVSSGGTYYIRVYYGNAGNIYDLWWDDFDEDSYEENDTLATAWHPGYNWVRTWLSSINGLGVQADEDWYRIDVDLGADRVQVACWFTDAEGDIDIALYDSTGSLLAESTSVTDDEFIDHTIVSGGTYYVRVHWGNAGNTYDLWWDDFSLKITLVSDFGSNGIWQHDGSVWSRLTASDPEYMAVYNNKLVGDFGGGGLWEFDGTSWSKLTQSDADNSGNPMVAYGANLVVDFGSGGIWEYDGSSWSRLTASDPEYMAVYDTKLVGDFGLGGLWEFDGTSWSKLTQSDADNTGNSMVAYGTSLVVDFGAGGVWQYYGSTWSRLASSNPEHLGVYDTKLVGDFGLGGLWQFNGFSWTKLTQSDIDNTGKSMVAYGANLAIDFGGGGIWEYDGSSWSSLTPYDPEDLSVCGTKLVGDFGLGGLWQSNGTSWSKLTQSDADNNGNCMVSVDFM